MGKVKTKVINMTGGEISLQEGNQNVYTVIAKLCNDKPYVISLDPNATYRDYVFLIMPDRTQLESSISSDDCLEYSEIKIMRGANNTYFLERVPRASRRTPAPANPASAPANPASAPANPAPALANSAPAPANSAAAPANPAPAPGIKTSAVGNGASKNFYQKIKNAVSSFF